jgi:hypothetical protein
MIVLAVLLGTVTVRLGCAWSCRRSAVTATTEHCHETSAAAFEFSAVNGCDEVRSGQPLFAATVLKDVAMFVPVTPVSLISAVPGAMNAGPALAPERQASPPPGFAVPLRQ